MKLYFDPFVIPFSIGFLILLGVLFYKYIRWYRYLPKSDKKLIRQGLFTRKSLLAMREIFYESLLHRKIFKVNPRLGYMHMSLAFGWFLLIVVGKVETLFYLDDPLNPPYVPVFFRFYFPDEPLARATYINFAFFMDFLLLFVLTGLAMAFMKRMKPSTLGMKRTTKHTLGDRVALSALWFIFPLRLLAESLTCGIYQSGSFLTGTLGKFLATFLPVNDLAYPAWWAYSLALGSFFIAMPFSRYMHILTEIPLIFLRQYGLKANESYTSYSDFQVQTCSRCGICIDPCQLNTAAGITDVQSVYVLRDHREKKTCRSKVENCLLCGRCENVCPVGIELNTLRISLRNNNISESSDRFSYLPVNHNPIANAKVGYFAGCMSHLTPGITHSMEKIMEASGTDYWFADRDGGICCGRPLKMAGQLDSAAKLIKYNQELFITNEITTLVTSCPICLKVFKEDYKLKGIRVLHHSQFILELIQSKKINLTKNNEVFTYHDPCELGRGSGIFDEPREVISNIGSLIEPASNRENALCCGGSLGNLQISNEQQQQIAQALHNEFDAVKADAIITACPLCKKTLAHNNQTRVADLAEIVASSLHIDHIKSKAKADIKKEQDITIF